MGKVTVSGELVVDAEWPDAAWSQIRDYCKRNNTANPSDLMFSAGALALRGPVGLDLKPIPGCRVAHRAMLALSGRVGDAPFLGSTDGSGHREWRVQATYAIMPDEDKPITMPIWLTPTIVPGSDRRSLDLEFQWATDELGDDGLKLAAIDRLSIDVPAAWGRCCDRPSTASSASTLPRSPAGAPSSGAKSRTFLTRRAGGTGYHSPSRHRSA